MYCSYRDTQTKEEGAVIVTPKHLLHCHDLTIFTFAADVLKQSYLEQLSSSVDE